MTPSGIEPATCRFVARAIGASGWLYYKQNWEQHFSNAFSKAVTKKIHDILIKPIYILVSYILRLQLLSWGRLFVIFNVGTQCLTVVCNKLKLRSSCGLTHEHFTCPKTLSSMTQIIRNPVQAKQAGQTATQNSNKYPQIHGKILNILKYVFQ